MLILLLIEELLTCCLRFKRIGSDTTELGRVVAVVVVVEEGGVACDDIVDVVVVDVCCWLWYCGFLVSVGGGVYCCGPVEWDYNNKYDNSRNKMFVKLKINK